MPNQKPPMFLRAGAALLALAFAPVASAATTVVNSIPALQSAISSAVAGDIIVLQNGHYTTTSAIVVDRAGVPGNPITIAAESIGGAIIGGSHGFTVRSPGKHIEIEGFRFVHQSGRNSISSGATHVRFTRNVFECSGDGAYLTVAGHDAQIDRNEFRNKSTVGNMIDVRGTGSQIAQRVWIHHNYFHDFTSPGENGAETVRFGLSGLSLSQGLGILEHNLFVRCAGENEAISIKASAIIIRYNTILEAPGTQLTQRHGNDCLIYGNYMRGTDGIRIFGDRHQIFSNYLEGNSGGINIGNGGGEVADGDPLTSHDRPDDCVITFNTLIDNTRQYYMTGRTNGLGATNITFANNIIQGGTTAASISSTGPYTGTWSDNILWNVPNPGNMPASGYTVVDPLLAPDATGIFRLQPGSPAIDAGGSSFPAVTADMDGQPREGAKDTGADELSSAPVTARLLTPADVGTGVVVPPIVSKPVFTPAAGTYVGPQMVELSSATPDATFRYTIDGSTPTRTSGTIYSGPIAINSDTTLKAIAYAEGLVESSVSTANYMILPAGSLRWEAELLPLLAVGAPNAVQNDANNSAGKWMALLADGVGDYIEYTLSDVPAGTYHLLMGYKGHPDRGILALAVDGTPLGNTLDQYSGPSIYPEVNFGAVTFPTAGNHVIRLTVVGQNPSAGKYTLSSDTFTLVRDNQPPVIQNLTSSHQTLWPPNHKMVPVTLTAQVSDAADPAPLTRIISVESNQPVNGNGDGNTSPDWQITGDMTLNLRAERAGGSARIYTITVESRDANGNASTATVQVTVPANQGG